MTKGELTVCGKTTLDAVRLLHDNHQLDYKETWTQAIVNHTSSDSTRKKGCPKNAFEDLCKCGYVKGIQKQQEDEWRRFSTAINILLDGEEGKETV